ncbi:unnamed protein product [Effrenium voratum]|uniref:Protein kinase domain-containing protein n=1 Tax=Effrenium voratum TaxID=2562239 RepID=A0AA36J2W5_9DINO|nr:unnamed protein product [Effrenium voratum]
MGNRLSDGSAPRGNAVLLHSDDESESSRNLSICSLDSELPKSKEGCLSIPGLELVKASPVPSQDASPPVAAPGGYIEAAPERQQPRCSSLVVPQATSSPRRTWGSTGCLANKAQSSSPLKRRCQRVQTLPAGLCTDDSLPSRSIKGLEEGQKIYDVYYWEQVIQEDGDGGKVVFCRKKEDEAENKEFNKVMKIKSKLKLQKEGFGEQYRKVLAKMMSLPPHPGIMPVEEALEDDAFYYVVAPRASNSFFAGLLLDFEDGVVPEAALRSLMTDMLEALDHLHSHGVLHRDIKPDNMVLQAETDEATGTQRRRVVLIDFDHADSDFPNNGSEQERIYGTRRFNAPETYLCTFSRQSDLYSVGVVFYMLMTGKMPYSDELFDGLSQIHQQQPGPRILSPRAIFQDTFQRLRDAEVDWNCDPWPLQPVSMDLCKQLLAFSPALRPRDARAALSHPWFL